MKTRVQPSTPVKRKVLLVDDHACVREGIAELINHQDDLVVCAEAENAQSALPEIAAKNPDIAIIDISLDGRSGLELVKDIRNQYPKLPTLVLSMHDENLYAERVLQSGARGYIMKRQSKSNLLAGIRQVLNGQYYVSEKISARLLDRFAQRKNVPSTPTVTSLSDRELEVFEMIGQGRSTHEVAAKLSLSVKTVATHRENIKKKLNLQSAPELVRHAVLWAKEHQAE
jgi:DNA-binding NarL/FixJ family response regulator